MIEVEHLSKTYGSTTAIQDITFGAQPGEILGFLGPNGAGKTTTMRILAGYLPASEGTARVAGYDVHTDSMAVRQRIGYLPESPPLYPEMTVQGFLNFVAKIKGVPADLRQKRADIAMDHCGLLDKRKVLIRKLSKGYRQRVGIAQAIIHDPPVIILDEPTVGLDPRQINEVRQLIKGLAGSHTIILSTHILPEVSMTCDRVTIINRGQVVATDTPDNLTTRLSGESAYELEIKGDVDTALRLLSELAPVRQVALLGPEHLPEYHHRLRVSTEADRTLGAVMSAALVNAGLELHELRRQQATLEDVFLNLTTTEPATGAMAPPEVPAAELSTAEPTPEQSEA
ncbi:ABC transporter ATP-binding protein [Nodosilinea sp. LEGE 07298]|uniref:ABC transporter ATP-binding protein n=1 Tax=Nodosilinea sp. LEGE 07298 TaxID=2777970 RepID=UPI001D15060C|nr:ABC transporter ATP-binding protein [Nodosilinea sp. LEGE 07298]